jgi:FtsH-binding integral membrane protein
MMALGITTALCLGLTLFSFQTKIDVTGKGQCGEFQILIITLIIIAFAGIGMYLFAASWVLFIFGIICSFFLARQYPVLNVVYSGLLALLFCMFLVYDTQTILGGKKYSISPEEHIFAAIMLYVDVVYIFLAILNLGGRN